jgi:3-oxoacyl-[acyl-carrier-protein] synthase-3
MGVEKETLEKGDKAALLGIGSGLNCLMMGVEW